MGSGWPRQVQASLTWVTRLQAPAGMVNGAGVLRTPMRFPGAGGGDTSERGARWKHQFTVQKPPGKEFDDTCDILSRDLLDTPLNRTHSTTLDRPGNPNDYD